MRTLLALCLVVSGCDPISHRAPSDFFLDASVSVALQPTIRAGLTRAFTSLRLFEAPRGDVLVVSAGACSHPDFAGQVEKGPPNAIMLCGWGSEVASPTVRAGRVLALHHAVGHALDATHGGEADVMAPTPSAARLADLLRDEDHFHYTDDDMRNICAHASLPSCR